MSPWWIAFSFVAGPPLAILYFAAVTYGALWFGERCNREDT